MGCPAAFYINILSLFTEIFWSPPNCSQSRVEMSETPATAKLVIIISAMTGEVPTKFDIKSKSINTKCMEIIIDFDNYLSPAGPSASSPLSRRSRPGKVLNKVFRMEKVWQQGRRKVFSGAGERETESPFLWAVFLVKYEECRQYSGYLELPRKVDCYKKIENLKFILFVHSKTFDICFSGRIEPKEDAGESK